MIAGIFVGGQSRRMAGQPKGRLLARDTGEPLIVRSARLLRLRGLTPVLVGEARDYDDLLPDLSRVADAPAFAGPLGGLSGLLAFAESPLAGSRSARQGAALGARDGEHVLVLACDMPFVSAALIDKLAHGPGDEDVLLARGAGGFLEPLCARYRVASCAPRARAALAARELSLQALLRKLNVAELALSDAERAELRDWDRPEDIDHER